MVIKRKSFEIIDLKARRKTLSSKTGARITADMKVYIGNILNSFLMVVSLVDSPPPNIFISIFALTMTITLIM